MQQDAIEDELITLAEYEAAVHATLACAERAGLVAVPIPGEGLRPTRAGFEIPDADGVPDAETVGAGAAAIEECRAEHLDDIERAYTVQQTNVSADALDAAFLALADCMSSRGSIAAGTVLDFAAVNAQLVKVERSDSDIQWLRDYQECSLEVEAATGYRFQ
ncbi:MAG: hypothetical protein KC479_03695 [Dehalococcoidia bacterium]|nr:hypothetical protein [Dehalococcoidia bacterium]